MALNASTLQASLGSDERPHRIYLLHHNIFQRCREVMSISQLQEELRVTGFTPYPETVKQAVRLAACACFPKKSVNEQQRPKS
eukprot:2427428-Pleurochrysis_carterae.AAC.2